jgi:hypothetical protein
MIANAPPSRRGLIALLPIPAKDFIKLFYSVDRQTKASYTVYDALGQTMIANTILNGSGEEVIDTKNLSTGFYYLRYSENGELKDSRKFIKE